jgi:hypothetical protein
VTRLAFGTGSFSGQVQRALGQGGFTRLDAARSPENMLRFAHGLPQWCGTARHPSSAARNLRVAREAGVLDIHTI